MALRGWKLWRCIAEAKRARLHKRMVSKQGLCAVFGCVCRELTKAVLAGKAYSNAFAAFKRCGNNSGSETNKNTNKTNL